MLFAILAWRLSSLSGEASGPVADDAPTLLDAVAHAPQAPGEALALDIKELPKPMPVAVDRTIFRAYDIRGVVGRTLDRNVAELIGQAIGTVMQEQRLRCLLYTSRCV